MNNDEASKLKHDFINSISTIKLVSKSACFFIDRVTDILIENENINIRQIELFKQSMSVIYEESLNVENTFLKLINI